MLFGPVSISNSYNPISRQMMISYLERNHLTHHISRLLKPRSPVRRPGIFHWRPEDVCLSIKDVEELSELISDIESDRKRVPILLKHYLKLGGKVIGFNLDASFSDVLDGLVIVDLTETDRRLLDRFMSPEGASRFLAYHQTTQSI